MALPKWVAVLTAVSLLFLMLVGVGSGISFANLPDLHGRAKVLASVVGYGIAILSNAAGIFIFLVIDKLEMKRQQ